MSRNLFKNDSSEDEGNFASLNTNKEYATTYNKFRQKEFLQKFKDRGINSSDSDSSSDSDYSEEELVNNPEFDQEFLKTLSSLKSKDPKIYNKDVKFFDNVDIVVKPSKSSEGNKRAFTLKEYDRKVILEKGGVFDDEDSTEIDRPQSPSYAEEQKKIKEELKNIVGDDLNSEEEDFGGIFKRREKTKEEARKEEKDYVEWLAGKKDDIPEEDKEALKPLKTYWEKNTLSKQEKFLRDYILNNGYIDKFGEEVPTYDQIVGDENLSEDERELEKQAEFEEKYNFRFEEPDKEFIKRYPRTIENSVRKTDDKRKQKREELKERKRKEKEEKYKEIEMMKQLKKQEIEEKIQKLKEVTGNDELPFGDNEFEEDFDPVEHDKKMQAIFNDEYYQIDEGEEKPECPDIEELKIEDWDNFDPNENDNDECYDYEPHCEDEDFNMDCDYDPNSKQDLQKELIESTKDKRNRRKRKNRFMEMIKAEKPPFNPEDEKTYGDYIDEYYKMDCEDIIDDIPCRFKYVETVPNDFGLTIEEILLAKTKELNQWASLKKTVQNRSEYDEKRDVKIYKQKAKNEALKRKIFVSLYGPPSDEEGEKANEAAIDNNETNASEGKKKKRRKKKTKNQNLEKPLQTESTSGMVSKSDKEPNKFTSNTTEKSKDIDESKSERSTKNNKVEEKALNKDSTKSHEILANASEWTTENSSTEKSNDQLTQSHEKQTKSKKRKNGGTSFNEKVPQKKFKGDKALSGKTSTPGFKISNKNTNVKNTSDTKGKPKFKRNERTEINDERLKAYGINARKFHRQQKYGKFQNSGNRKQTQKKQTL